MPLEMIKYHNRMNKDEFENFFGFCVAFIKTPHTCDIPILPYKYKGQTIFPKGEWYGIYFSEELKEAMKQGKSVEPFRGYEFSYIIKI
jgi:hypothetical protein